MTRLARTDAGPTYAIHFCSHCGALAAEETSRVCEECGLGVMLWCALEMLTRPGAAFLVVQADLRISAVSVAAQEILGDAIGEPLIDVLSGDPSLPRTILRASMGSQRVVTTALRLGARRLNARIGACGDPPGALVVLQ